MHGNLPTALSLDGAETVDLITVVGFFGTNDMKYNTIHLLNC